MRERHVTSQSPGPNQVNYPHLHAPAQWIFEYTKPGKARKFTVHLSLQAASKRMFIHCSEEANPAK